MTVQAHGRALYRRWFKSMGHDSARTHQDAKLKSLEKHAARFIKNGLAEQFFTDDLYQLFTVECGLTAGFDRRSFYQHRFRQEASQTADLILLKPKEVLRPLCTRIAEAIRKQMRPVPGTAHFTIERED